MKLILAILATVATVCLVNAFNYEDRRSIRFVDGFDETDLFQSSIVNDIPIRLLKKIVAIRLNAQLKNIFLFKQTGIENDEELKDADTLDKYNLGKNPMIKVIVAGVKKYEFVDIATDNSLTWLEVDQTGTFADVKVALAAKLGIEGKRIILYYGQHELKDNQAICTAGINSADKIFVHLE